MPVDGRVMSNKLEMTSIKISVAKLAKRTLTNHNNTLTLIKVIHQRKKYQVIVVLSKCFNVAKIWEIVMEFYNNRMWLSTIRDSHSNRKRRMFAKMASFRQAAFKIPTLEVCFNSRIPENYLARKGIVPANLALTVNNSSSLPHLT